MPATTVTLVGNLTRQPELRYTATGQATATFGVAVNRRRQSKANVNEVTESVSFFTVIAWGSLAENVSQSLEKGARVVVQGRLEQRTWLDKEGERHTVYEVQADEVGPSLRWATAQVARVQRTSGAAPSPLAETGDDGGMPGNPGPGAAGGSGVPIDADDPFTVDEADAFDRPLVPA